MAELSQRGASNHRKESDVPYSTVLHHVRFLGYKAVMSDKSLTTEFWLTGLKTEGIAAVSMNDTD